nr:bacteriorhodopsin [Candidatus Saccharibacteria bacterium]NIW79625.1 bacteriorhodopsin [Calditrichia bacterium]
FTQSGHAIYFTRWLFYIASCALLMLTISKILNVKKENTLTILVLNSLVMLSGALAAVTVSPLKWIIFGLGSVFFGAQLYILFEKNKPSKFTKMVLYYISFGWAVFPAVFVFSPEGLDIISNYIAATLYLILDLFTKIIFYLHLAHFSKNK